MKINHNKQLSLLTTTLLSIETILSIFLIIDFSHTASFAYYECHACTSGCESAKNCDCANHSSSICMGKACFVKLERFLEEDVGFIIKGCLNIDVSESSIGCRFTGDDTSIDCLCNGDFCNIEAKLNFYKPNRPRQIPCCHCTTALASESETQREYSHAKPHSQNSSRANAFALASSSSSSAKRTCQDIGAASCESSCEGDYCFVDRTTGNRGCGFGYPQTFKELRTRNTRLMDTEQICINSKNAEYSALVATGFDGSQQGQGINGCVCGWDFCNAPNDEDDDVITENHNITTDPLLFDPGPNRTEAERLTSAKTTMNKMYSCYHFTKSSDYPVTARDFRIRFGNCSGTYCYLTMTTHQIVLESLSKSYDESESEDEDESESESEFDEPGYAANRHHQFYTPPSNFIGNHPNPNVTQPMTIAFENLMMNDQSESSSILNDQSESGKQSNDVPGSTNQKQVPFFSRKYDFLAGCMIANQREAVTEGCTVEYLENYTHPLTIHCVCTGDYCNSYAMLVVGGRSTGENDRRAQAKSAANDASTKNADANLNAANKNRSEIKRANANTNTKNVINVLTTENGNANVAADLFANANTAAANNETENANNDNNAINSTTISSTIAKYSRKRFLMQIDASHANSGAANDRNCWNRYKICIFVWVFWYCIFYCKS